MRPINSLIASDLPEPLRKIRATDFGAHSAGASGRGLPHGGAARLARGSRRRARRRARRNGSDWACSARSSCADGNSSKFKHELAEKMSIFCGPTWGGSSTTALGWRFRSDAPAAAICKSSIGDGLSVPAVSRQVPALLPLLYAGAAARGWKTGRAFVVRYCRVGILNEIGELLDARVVVLLIGERPGLATAESLSAYLAYRPRQGHTDSNRNLISNIHARGVTFDRRRRPHFEFGGANDGGRRERLHREGKPPRR